MKNYDWVEYEKVRRNRISGAKTLRVSMVCSRKDKRQSQMVLFIPEHLCRSAHMTIGERFNIRWTPDKKIASIYASKDGYKLSLSGGVNKGDSEKAVGSIGKASLKITLDENLRQVFFNHSAESYLPEIVSISNGNIVFRISAE